MGVLQRLRGAHSYYEATVQRAPQRPALSGVQHTQIGVVGGGIAGVSTALELAERGYQVTLLEAQRIGSVASGRNGGQVLAGLACEISTARLAMRSIAVVSADNLGSGIASAAFVAYLSSLTHVQYSATQYALFSSLMLLLPKFLAGFSGVAVDAAGYAWFFTGTALLGVPVLGLVWLASRTHVAEEKS